jgi:hypothetical protein
MHVQISKQCGKGIVHERVTGLWPGQRKRSLH